MPHPEMSVEQHRTLQDLSPQVFSSNVRIRKVSAEQIPSRTFELSGTFCTCDNYEAMQGKMLHVSFAGL
jgi:hypothetical protein